MDYYFFLDVYFRKVPLIWKKKNSLHFLGESSGSPYASFRIYLLRSCFSNYVYLKDMYICLKGIRKILSVSVLRILLFFKFLIFTTVFT